MGSTQSQTKTIGNYKINIFERHKKIQSSAANFYPGKHAQTNEPVVAKRYDMHKKYFNEEAFRIEADLLVNKIPLHQNVVTVYDYIKTESKNAGVSLVHLWLITEHCQLGNLKTYAEQNELTISQKIDLMYQSIQVVQHILEQHPELVIRIKPENFLVSKGKFKPIIKLCDLKPRAVISTSEQFVKISSSEYLSPEQTDLQDGGFAYNEKMATFSLGVLFLALLECSKGSVMEPQIGELYTNGFLFITTHRNSDLICWVFSSVTEANNDIWIMANCNL